ncbi:salicylate carboxymethyltransferase-like [Bidens hawaiensis]|uniref:salicylate carboxymethyltransferase-like n=1 Tax=Bidens hawaiensis TaxID=980011 RepID=UPI00404AA6E2
MGLESPEVQINLNDLPTNDFNTIFIALQEIKGNSTNGIHRQPSCYFTGVPWSYYGRLFPMKSLNFVHSSYSLHWLSQQPQLEEINKGNIYLASTTPESVSKAHFEQFQKDFFSFLRCRSKEIMAGGRMVLTLADRTTDDPRDEESNYIWRPLAMAIQEMVNEGLVEEAKFDSFNLPWYNASPKEISNLVKSEGSFTVDQLESFDLKWEAWKRKKNDNDASKLKETDDPRVGLYSDVAKAIRAGVEPLVANHFGEAILDDVFTRYEKILKDRTCNKEYEAAISVTVSLTKKCDI